MDPLSSTSHAARPARTAAPRSASAAPLARPITPEERAGVLAWLDAALRDGEPGRLAVEYPLSLSRSNLAGHRVAFEGDRPVAHAMFHVVRVRLAGQELPVGLIGLVYTDPSRRGQGFARSAVEACVAELRRRSVPVAALWAENPSLYTAIGFAPAGREFHYSLAADVCARAHSASLAGADAADLKVDVARARDWSILEALYSRKASRAVRARGALRRLARAPHTRVMVARRRNRAIAYTAIGRGLDFPGVVHEWAGGEAGVLACLDQLAREHGSIGFRSGPLAEAPVPRLLEMGAPVRPGCFAFLKVLDPVAIWQLLVAGEPTRAAPLLEESPAGTKLHANAGTLTLHGDEVVALLFGPDRPPRIYDCLDARERETLAQVLPLPLYLWGFDSI